MVSILKLLVLAHFALATPKLPPEAEKVIAELPDRALTVPMVVGRAATVSESFKEVTAQAALQPYSELAAKGLFTPKLTATAGHYEDQLEVAIPAAGPSEKSGVQYKVGLEKYFSTGTAAGVSVEHNYNKLVFSGSAFFSRAPYYQTITSLNLSQNLLQDSFGSASRAQLRAASLSGKAQTARVDQTLEQWTMAILNQFYEAWLSQRSAEVADQRLANRQKLLQATKLKEKRGTAEAPDRLQVESVYLSAVSLRDEADQNLNDKWRTLILTLKLPSEWMSIDARFVPIKLDDPIPRAKDICADFRKNGVPKDESAEVRVNKYMAEAADEMLTAKKNIVRPQLALVGEVKFNGIEDIASDSLSEGTGTDHPYWLVGLNLSWPLGLDAEKSDAIQAYSDRLRAEALFRSSKDDLRISWLNSCSNLDRLGASRKMMEEAVQKLSLRERLEEKRFQLGRLNVFNYIQAGDDASQAELSLSRLEVAYRMAAWQIFRLGNSMRSTLESWKTKSSEKFNQ